MLGTSAISNRPTPRSGWQACHRRYTYGACLLSAVVLLLSGCAGIGSHSTAAHVSPIPHSSITQTVQAEQHGLVTVQVQVFQQHGTTAGGMVSLGAQVTVTNHTDKIVYLYQTCNIPSIFLSLTPIAPQGSVGQMRQLTGGGPCLVSTNGIDVGTVSPLGSLTVNRYANLYDYYPDWQPGAYILSATVPAWHQGTLGPTNGPDKSLPCAPGSDLLCGSAQGQTVITLS
jgi:hypothetical protein